MDNMTFSEIKLDVLREFINVGTGNAATALSEMIDKKISVNLHELRFVELNNIPKLLGGDELPVTAFFFRISHDITGGILLFFSSNTAEILSGYLTSGMNINDPAEKEQVVKSALKELGNIMCNSYINAIAEMLDMKIFISVPFYAADMLGSVIDFLVMQIAEVSDYALVMETTVSIENGTDKSRDDGSTDIKCNFLLLPDVTSYEKIFNKTGIK
jgi:chemotaxis protein CheC